MEGGGTPEALESLRAEGNVRFIGMSGTLPHLPDHIAMGVFDVFQIPYSALQPEHDELISRAANAGAGVLIRGAVARGTASEDKNWTVQPLSSSGPAAQDRWGAAKLDEPRLLRARIAPITPAYRNTGTGAAECVYLHLAHRCSV